MEWPLAVARSSCAPPLVAGSNEPEAGYSEEQGRDDVPTRRKEVDNGGGRESARAGEGDRYMQACHIHTLSIKSSICKHILSPSLNI